MNRLRKQRGVAAVELALLLTFVLVPLLFGMTELGRALFQFNTLTKATRDATRFLSAQGPGDPNDISAAQCLAVYGNKTCTGTPLVSNLTTAMVSVCDRSNCATHLNQATGSGVINLVTVTVTGYTFTSLAPFFVPTFTFGDISTTMRQVL
jgi:Flp pilus assembly protein TadG